MGGGLRVAPAAATMWRLEGGAALYPGAEPGFRHEGREGDKDSTCIFFLNTHLNVCYFVLEDIFENNVS